MINEQIGSKCVRLNSDENLEKEKTDSRLRKEIVSDIFRTSRIRPNSIKLPNCKLSRGLLTAIVFFFLFVLLIIWFVFSSDAIDENPELKWRKQNGSKNESANMATYDYSLSDDKLNLSNKLFVLFTTVFIVLAIISFVFIGALVHYFQKPKYYGSGSRSQSIVSSIFSHHNHHNHLYYLDRDILREDEIKKKRNRKKKSRQMPDEGSSEIVNVERNVLSTPTIIVIETENM